MLREALVATVLLLVGLAPTAPALPPACAAATAEESLQDDAGSGADAPDVRADAYRIPADDYYWGYLSAIDHGAADLSDWYVFAVPADTKTLMAGVIVSAPLVPPDPYAPEALQRFFLAVHAPDGTTWTTDSASGRVLLMDPAPGDYHVELTATTHAAGPICGASPGDAGAPGTPLARNHGLYIGCNPLCVEGANGDKPPVIVI